MIDAGLRCNEVRQLTLDDLYWNGAPRKFLEVDPKTAKYGVGGSIPLSPRLMAALTTYAQVWALPTDPPSTAPAFPGTGKARTLTTRQIRRIVHNAGQSALGRHVWCHLCRHTFGDTLRRTGADVKTRMLLMRHKDVRSTMVYDHPDDTDKAAAITAMAALQENPS